MQRHKHTGGYVMLKLADGTRMLEHRYVMEQQLGRALTSEDVVHHKNHVRSDNDLSNLELHDKASHGLLHAEERVAEVTTCVCESCGKLFERKATRLAFNKATGRVNLCSKRCVGRYSQ